MADGGVKLGRVAPCVAVADIARSVAFYERIFGFRVTFENGTPTSFAILKCDAAELHLQRVAEPIAPSYNVLHLLVEAGVDELHRRCVDAGAPIVSALRDAPWHLRTFVVADPDGNKVDVGQPQYAAPS